MGSIYQTLHLGWLGHTKRTLQYPKPINLSPTSYHLHGVSALTILSWVCLLEQKQILLVFKQLLVTRTVIKINLKMGWGPTKLARKVLILVSIPHLRNFFRSFPNTWTLRSIVRRRIGKRIQMTQRLWKI